MAVAAHEGMRAQPLVPTSPSFFLCAACCAVLPTAGRQPCVCLARQCHASAHHVSAHPPSIFLSRTRNTQTRAHTRTRPTARQVAVVTAAIAQGADNFKITASPDLIPDGPWVKDSKGNCCSPKGFKATGQRFRYGTRRRL